MRKKLSPRPSYRSETLLGIAPRQSQRAAIRPRVAPTLRWVVALLIAGSACTPPARPRPSANPLPAIITRTGFTDITQDPEAYRLQVILTEIRRDRDGRPHFTEHRYRAGAEYFYPASTVKLPTAVVALEQVHALRDRGVTRDTWMVTHPLLAGDTLVSQDTSAANGRPSVAHYTKKILLVSDNDAFNRLYEFTGQRELNARLRALGFAGTEIIHRLERFLPPADNARTNGVSFRDDLGTVLHEQPPRIAEAYTPTRTDLLGRGYMTGGQLVEAPFDFSLRNQWTLESAHRLTQWILFPESQPAERRLRLTADDYAFLREYMAMWPAESTDPRYAPESVWPTYVKFLYYGSDKDAQPRPSLRIYNKVGNAYGFLTDAAYFHDETTGVEFLLSATIYVNSNGVLNDSTYDYDTIGLPFLRALGREVYAYAQGRALAHRAPDSP